MKKGFTLIELMVVMTIMGILAAVAVPKMFSMICENDLGKCKEKPQLFQDFCFSHPKKCLEKDVYEVCSANTIECMKHQDAFIISSTYQRKLNKKKEEEKPVQTTQQVVVNVDTEKLKQELLAEYEKKLDSITKIVPTKPVEEVQIQGSKEEFIKCIKKCTRENTAESLVDFCIKDKCK